MLCCLYVTITTVFGVASVRSVLTKFLNQIYVHICTVNPKKIKESKKMREKQILRKISRLCLDFVLL